MIKYYPYKSDKPNKKVYFGASGEPTTFSSKLSKLSKLLETSRNFSKLFQFFGEPLEKSEKLSPISEIPLYRELYFQHVFNFQQTKLGYGTFSPQCS
jgi:hypothetical protein